MTKMQTGNLLALGLALMLVSGIARAEVTATVDRTTITEFDLVTLTVRASDELANVDPVYSGLERDFEIVNAQTRQSSSTTIANGRRTSVIYRDHVLTLRAKRLGRLTIPSIQVGTSRTRPIEIRAQQQASSTRQKMNELVFFETVVDTNETYVQAQIIYSVRLFYTEAIGGDFPQPPVIEDAVVETIETEKRYESIVDGRRFYVLEKRYAIFPQRSGKLEIRRETFTGTRGRGGFFSERQRVNAVSGSHTVAVKTIPPGFTGDAWIPAKALAISESWADAPPTFRVGEPINRKLTISAVGLSESLLPPLGDLPVDDAKIYADPPASDKRVGTDGITALQTTTIGVVPTKEGELTLPEIRIPWWNTRTDREEIAIVPAATYTVLPAASVSANAPRVTVPITEPSATDIVQAPVSLMWQYIEISP